MDETKPFPPFSLFLAPSLLLTGLGLGGLVLVITQTLPTLIPRWLFFFLATLAVTGISLPIAYFLNWRFSLHAPPPTGSILREALLAAIYFDLLAWLQLERLLTVTLALIFAIGFFILEFLLRMIEQVRWKPEDHTHEA